MGGMQRHSFFLAKYLAKNKVNVDLYHYKDRSSPDLPHEFTDEELKFLSLHEVKYPGTMRFPGHYIYERWLYSKRVFEAMKSHPKPDYIYIKGFAGLYILSKRGYTEHSQARVGVNFHGFEMFQRWPDLRTGLKFQILRKPVRYSLRRADHVISYGGKVSEIIRNLGYGKKIVEIPSGISEEWIRSSEEVTAPTDVIKFIFVGRSERRKGIDEIVQAIRGLNSASYEFHFVGPVERRLESNEQVVYHGPVHSADRIREILDEMDVLVCPSHSEGMPNVILEAMARGLAIIATDVGAVSTMVDSTNGWLLPRPDVELLTQTLCECLCTDSDIKARKLASIQKVSSNFTWEKIIETTLNRLR